MTKERASINRQRLKDCADNLEWLLDHIPKENLVARREIIHVLIRVDDQLAILDNTPTE